MVNRDDQSRRSPDEGGEDLGLGGKFKGCLWVEGIDLGQWRG